MPETKIRETRVFGDSGVGAVRVVIADSEPFDEADLHIAVLVQSNVDGPFLAHIQREALRVAQEAIAAALDDCKNRILQHDGDL